MEELDERKVKILNAIIQNYMETGEPVGSRTISKSSDLNLSSATIRNEMSDLEELGYIVQPHTSAGRIPSDKGYRFYVDHLIAEKDEEISDIKDLMIEKTEKMEIALPFPLGTKTKFRFCSICSTKHTNSVRTIFRSLREPLSVTIMPI